MSFASHVRNTVIAFFIAMGVLVVWMFAGVMIYSTASERHQAFQHERIEVEKNGRPIIRKSSLAGMEYRTLDGDMVFVPPKNKPWMTKEVQQYPDIVRNATLRLERPVTRPPSRTILGNQIEYGKHNDIVWYLVRRKVQSTTKFYLEAFGWTDGLRKGYIGMNGFSETVPRQSEWFMLTHEPVSESNRLDMRPWLFGRLGDIYFLSGGDVIHIDFSRKTATSVRLDSKPVGLRTDAWSTKYWPTAVRTESRILVLRPFSSPATGYIERIAESFEIPPAIRAAKFLTVHHVNSSEIVIEASERLRGSRSAQLWRIREDDVSTHIGTFELTDSMGEVVRPLVRAAIVPSFLPQLLSLSEAQLLDPDMHSPDHRARVSQSAVQAIGLVAVISIMFALLVLILERRARRRGLAWALFVFLFGIPGLIGYSFHRKWPSRITCEKCHTAQANRRRNCSACEYDMIPGIPLATDIFA